MITSGFVAGYLIDSLDLGIDEFIFNLAIVEEEKGSMLTWYVSDVIKQEYRIPPGLEKGLLLKLMNTSAISDFKVRWRIYKFEVHEVLDGNHYQLKVHW